MSSLHRDLAVAQGPRAYEVCRPVREDDAGVGDGQGVVAGIRTGADSERDVDKNPRCWFPAVERSQEG